MASPDPLAWRPIVVVVDDEPMVRSFMTKILSPHYHVAAAADGQQAVDLILGLGPDVRLVVTDIQMPRLNGLALAAQLRAMERPPAVLFVSGYTQETEVPGPLLEKPFLPAALLGAVSRLLADSLQSEPTTGSQPSAGRIGTLS